MTDSRMTTTWEPTEADLDTWAKILLDAAYGARPRRTCSREDFGAGFTAALAFLRWRTAFSRLLGDTSAPIAWPEPLVPLPSLVDELVAAGPDGTRSVWTPP